MSIVNLSFKSFSQLPQASGTAIQDTDLLVIQTASGTKKLPISELKIAGPLVTNSVPLSQKGVASGVATLDTNGTIPDVQIPATITRDTELTSALTTKANTSHTHVIADVTNLQSNLDTKANSSTLAAHTSNTSNPHGVTTNQIGAVDLTTAQTVSGVKTFSNGLKSGTAGITLDVTGYPSNPVTIGTYNNGTSEFGISVPMLKCSGGRFDFDPDVPGNKAEFRVTGLNTQFNIYNLTQSQPYFTINSDRTVNLFNTVSISGGMTATGSGSFNSLSLTTALPIASGGTGSSNASAARTALGVAARGANSDITSLSGLTTALSIAQGGTGSTTAASARSALSAASSGANSDITSLTGLTTALSIAQGGTGSTSASAARTALGLVPSTAQYNASQLQSQTLSSSAPSTGNILAFRGTQWQPQQARTIVQSLQSQISVAVNTTSSTFSNSGLSVTITPTNTSSQILVLVNLADVYKTAVTHLGAQLVRSISGGSTTNFKISDGAGYTNSAAENLVGSVCHFTIDSPATTNAVTYTVQIRNANAVGSVSVSTNATVSSLIVMEIL